jgi:pyruvate dehydrogenase E1 component beta subunit
MWGGGVSRHATEVGRSIFNTFVKNRHNHDNSAAMAWAISKRLMSTNEMTVREALSTAIDEEMSADSKVLVLGEEVLGVFHL